MFDNPHHQRIARILLALNGPLLQESGCLFGGGTAIVLRQGEYRESVDVDFLVSDPGGYRWLRQVLTGPQGFASILRAEAAPIKTLRDLRADQYGIRTMLEVGGQPIKFEIVLEGRIEFSTPTAQDEVCGIRTLSRLDLAASKLLANSDRWADDSVFSRDLIDLAMLEPPLPLLRKAVAKAEVAYGQAILRDLDKAICALQERAGRLERCMQALSVRPPKALLWERIRRLKRVLASKVAPRRGKGQGPRTHK